MDQVRESNPSLIQNEFIALQAALPDAMAAIILRNQPLTTQPPVSDEIYLKYARLIDKTYQSASRWLLQEPSLSAYAARAYMDIRGYYFLSKESELGQKLSDWNSLESSIRARLQGWLLGECRNSQKSLATCTAEFNQCLTSEGGPAAFHAKYQVAAKRLFDRFFLIGNARSDSKWNAGGNVFTVPFQTPNEVAVRDWLQTNVEDEWRFGDFNLRINFGAGSFFSPRVVFEPGATPHVNGLGGNTITMDANRSLDEYSTRWTIRHEFGHVLGSPDCYIEFFDAEREVMVSYQIDITNLMCSRRGKLQQMHVDELKRAYRVQSSSLL